MPVVNMFEAKSNLSRLVEAVESGSEREIVIARNGRPVARLVPMPSQPAGQRIGGAEGKFTAPGIGDAHDAVIAELFSGPTR